MEHIDENMNEHNEYVDKSFAKKKQEKEFQNKREISEKNLERLK